MRMTINKPKAKKKAEPSCGRCAPSRREYFVAAVLGGANAVEWAVNEGQRKHFASKAIEMADEIVKALDGEAK